MPFIFLYASFPNSRFKLRSPTVEANTYQMNLNFRTQPLVLVASANLNRTYLLITNEDGVIPMRYLYATTLPIDPSVVPTFGVLYQLIYNSGTNTLYQKQDDGVNTNWIVVLPENVGEIVQPYQSAELESLEDIYAMADDPATGISIAVDAGRG
jgi:hypothetical protein